MDPLLVTLGSETEVFVLCHFIDTSSKDPCTGPSMPHSVVCGHSETMHFDM